MRSVFVGNIPYDATEEQLIDIFREVGPVVSFQFVFDKETGKPKGVGFCEFADEAAAASAKRNLNGRELHGRTLWVVDAAAGKRAREEDDAPPEQPARKKPRLQDVLEQVRDLPPDELAGAKPAVRAQLAALCEVLKLDA